MRGNDTAYQRDAFGLTHNVTNALDQSTGFGYSPDGRNNLISITDDDGTQTTFDYLDPANPNRVTAVNTASGTIHYTYNAWGQITSVTDRRDKTWYYRYDTAGNLHEIEDPLTHITTLQYDNLGRLTTITDANGVVTRYQYDASDNLYRLTRNYDPACNDTNKCNLITDYNFDQSGLLWRIVTPDGRQTRYIRNNARQLVRITRNWQDAVFSDSEPDKDINTRYGYDSSGRLFQIFERLNQTKERQTRIEYDALSRVQQVIFNYVSGSGAPDANLITSYAYTDDGRQSLVDVTDPTGLVTRYRYDELNRLIKVMTNYSPGCNTDDCNLTTQYVYDNVGNLEQLIDPNNIVTQYGYDPLYRLTSVIEAYNHGGPVSDVATAFQYDAEGNLEQLTINNEQLENYTYDALNRLDTTTDALGHSWNYTYDPAGNLSQIQNPKSQIINLVYDDLNRLETTDYPNSDPDVTFAYDAMGNRTQMIDGSDATAYGYDGLNRPLTLQNSQFTIHYLYDGLGNRTRLTYPDGKFISYDYDEADRLDTLTVSWDGLYDYGYANHRLDTLTRPGGLETHYGYDEAGRLDSLTHQLGTQTLAAFSYVLDKAGNIAQASELLSLPPTYYLPVIFKNSSQTLTSITVPEKSAPVTSPTAVAPVDGSIFRSPLAAPLPTATPTPEPSPTPTAEPVTLDRLRAELDSAAANGALSARLHQELRKKLDKAAQALDKGNVDDAIAELNVFSFSLLSKRGLGAAPETADLLMNLARQLIEQWQAQAISSFRISGLAYPLFTAAGPLPDGSTLARLPWLQSATSRTISYQYDALYRLIDANYSDGKSFHYGYDAAGNRLNMTVNGQTTTNYVYNAVNRLTSVNGQSYSYDDNGNLTGDGLHTYAYDSANRLTSVSGGGASAQFAYNGDGDIVSQTVNGVTTNYALDPAGLAQVLMATTSGQSRFYVPGLAQYDNSWQYFVPDRLGSVRQLVNPGGQVVLGQSFDPFGNVIEQGRVVPSVFGYAGEQTDPTGLVFLRARYYSPEVGRFLTPDTLVPDPLRSQPWNRYAYVENNSVRYVDPSGHSFEPMCVFGKDPKTGECKTPLPPVLGAAVSQPATNPAQAALEAVVIGYLFLTQFPLHAPDFGQQPGTSLEQGCNEAGGFQLADVLDLLPPVLRQPESEVVPQVGVPGTSLERPEVLGDGVSRISKADSPVWQGLDPYKDSIKKSGKGKKTLYYEWDYTHNDIEVYDRKGNHRGSMDPVTGEIYKPAVPGRKLNF